VPKLTFRGSYIRFCDLRYDEDSASSHTRIEITADFSEPIAREMQWNPMAFIEELPAKVQEAIAKYFAEHGGGHAKWMEMAGITQAKLKGRIAATTIEFIPNAPLKDNAISLEANEARAFVVKRLLTKEGTTKSLELNFQIAVSQKGAAGLIEAYLDVVGQGACQLKIGYAKQEDLDLKHGGDDDEKEEPQERLISREQAEDTTKEDEPAAKSSGPTLAPRVLVEGNAKKRRSQEPRDRTREGWADGSMPDPVN
jgi:hypothetical protein